MSPPVSSSPTRRSIGRLYTAAAPFRSPTSPPIDPVEKLAARRPNSFQLLGGILSAAIGVRANSARGRGFAEASGGAIFGAVLIIAAVGFGCCYAFVQAIKSAVAN